MFQRLKSFTKDTAPFIWKRITKKYYIIRRSEMGAGFFSNYMWVMGHIVFAKKLGYIPVVDMENYPTFYSEKEPVNGTCNAWNYYFEDVDKVGLDEAYSSGKYILGRDKYLTKYAEKYSTSIYRYPTNRMIAYYTPVMKKNIRVKKNLLEEFETEWNLKVKRGNRVLGVHVRGTDMKVNPSHPTPPSFTEYIKVTKDLLKKHQDITHIFLATDEDLVKELYEKEFQKSGIELFTNRAFRACNNGEEQRIGIHEINVEQPRPHHKYLLGLEVLRDAWFLSKCDYLVCSHSNVANVAILWNENQYHEIVCMESQNESSN